MRFTGERGAPDGTRIATFAEAWDSSSGGMIGRGIYLADVALDATGRPVVATNFRLLVALPGIPILSWSGDGRHIAYNSSAPDAEGGTQEEIWVYDLDAGTSRNVTNTPGSDEVQPAFSPMGDLIAFARRMGIQGSYLYDIFTIPATGGKETRVTTKKTTGAPANRHPCFSPDGQYLSFASGDVLKFYTDSRIYKIRADGSGKAVSLYGKRGPVIHGHAWRP